MSESNPSSRPQLSVVLPAKNEAASLVKLIPAIDSCVPEGTEIVVVDDGSSDDTAEICRAHPSVKLYRHRYSLGNGAAIKTGARKALGDVLVFMDSDGQHEPQSIHKLTEKIAEGYDMVVGARQYSDQASLARLFANHLYNRLASWMTGYHIADLTSGFRAVRARKFRRFLYLLPNKFSYPTTSTMAFFRSGYSVAYVPVRMHPREGNSHIRMWRDGMRFLIIILKIGALFSPMRLFLPVSGSLFVTGICYYAYTYTVSGRFTNMSALLFVASILTFLIGIVAEQISALHYKDTEPPDSEY